MDKYWRENNGIENNKNNKNNKKNKK